MPRQVWVVGQSGRFRLLLGNLPLVLRQFRFGLLESLGKGSIFLDHALISLLDLFFLESQLLESLTQPFATAIEPRAKHPKRRLELTHRKRGCF